MARRSRRRIPAVLTSHDRCRANSRKYNAYQTIREEGVLQRIEVLEKQLREGLEPLRSLECVGDVRVIGGVGVVELIEAGGYLAGIGPKLYREFLSRGILLRPLGNVLYFMPPYVITEEETARVIEQITEVLQDLD